MILATTFGHSFIALVAAIIFALIVIKGMRE